ncbi:Post-GPI attachment to proteins factor 2 [Fasciola gigantica]|uniref:Post-GPI attachment to proteins factor 2 n=1 Tax=Fasciola gigantica TaxID=46835 RepID=A0A504YGY1_FASGI|nr:Post-GPI attachment to proteins factor 2 [Fasciola gigantica]
MLLGPCIRSLKALIIFTCLMPVAALVVCIYLCIHMGKCLATHCTDMNILPSLSAAVSDEIPQRTIWITSLLLSSFIRFLGIPHGYSWYQLAFSRAVDGDFTCIIKTMFVIHVVEILFLNIMSIFPSAYQYEAHRNSLAIFVFSSVLYMICDTCLFSLLTQHVSAKYMAKRKRTKQFLLAAYVLSLFIVALCYFIHAAYCPPYVYSIFSFFEYVGIVINVCYHYTVYRFIENRPLCTVVDYWSPVADFTEIESL